MRYVIALLAVTLFALPASAQVRGRSSGRSSMMRMMQQRQQQFQAMQKTAAEQQAKLIAAQQAATQRRREMHHQANDSRREKEKSLRERAIARRKLEAAAPETRENPMATPIKAATRPAAPSPKPVATGSSKSP